MLHFFKFASEVPAPVPAKETYHKRKSGKGWPEECPPLRAANALGWDLLAPTDLEFVQEKGRWSLANPVDLESDWLFASEENSPGAPLSQRNAWFWDVDQMLPHVISPEVYPEIANQVKVSTFLYFRTDPNEQLLFGEVPNLRRPFRTLSALVDTDWYPASYPWHCVLELDRSESRIRIEKGTPLCRAMVIRRDFYVAREMALSEFESFFQRGQDWLARHGRGDDPEMLDITRTYVKSQRLSRFDVVS